MIISNPPFFEKSLKSKDAARNAALHGSELKFEDLISSAEKLMAPSGIFAVLLPYEKAGYFEKLAAKKNFYVIEEMLIKQSPTHNYFRSILVFSRQQKEITITEMIICDTQMKYTAEFAEWLKGYYLYL